MTDIDHQATWDEHYSAKPQIWSGRVNTQLALIAPTVSGTRALDLGCGEGADAIWLAEHGWTVVAVDVSPIALNRARDAAETRGVADRIEFERHDLTTSLPEGPFDLVSAHFLHSLLEWDRPVILRRAAATLVPEGVLLIVDHAAGPPWAATMHHHEFPTAEAVVAELGLDPAQWRQVRADTAERVARGPDGEEAILLDNVIQFQRVG
jgi:SAM-dependent methyltransferase